MMKKGYLFSGLFVFCQMFGQSNLQLNRTIEWANYYFINENYKTAISKYLSLDDNIPHDARRNFAKSYARLGNLKKAEKILRPLVDSDDAVVLDYYHFASYITENESLKNEYREKALRLPITDMIIKPSADRESSYNLVNLNINTTESEFGAYLLENNDKTELIYTKKQSKKYNQGLKKRIKSDSDIYNLYHAKFNSKELKVDEGTPYPNGINSVFQDGPASWDELNNQFYFTRSSGNYKKEDLIQLDLYSLNYSEIDEKRLLRELNQIEVSFRYNIYRNASETFLNGLNVEQDIRSLWVSKNVSKISKIKAVREKMVSIQQALGQHKGVVMDGRDIGTVVFPDAELKLFITASLEERALRRHSELEDVSIEDVIKNLGDRDFDDTTREENPLKKAENAIVIDNTNLSREEQFTLILKYCLEAMQ